jgi:hypothetical protein
VFTCINANCRFNGIANPTDTQNMLTSSRTKKHYTTTFERNFSSQKECNSVQSKLNFVPPKTAKFIKYLQLQATKSNEPTQQDVIGSSVRREKGLWNFCWSSNFESERAWGGDKVKQPKNCRDLWKASWILFLRQFFSSLWNTNVNTFFFFFFWII